MQTFVDRWIRLWRLRPGGADPRLSCLGRKLRFHPEVMTMIKLLVIVQHDSRWRSIRESSQQLTSDLNSGSNSIIVCQRFESLTSPCWTVGAVRVVPEFLRPAVPHAMVFQLTALLAPFKQTVSLRSGKHMTLNDYNR